MTVFNMDRMFQPKSVAVIGASGKTGSIGTALMNNLIRGGFRGPVYPVNPLYETICGRRAFPSVAKKRGNYR